MESALGSVCVQYSVMCVHIRYIALVVCVMCVQVGIYQVHSTCECDSCSKSKIIS